MSATVSIREGNGSTVSYSQITEYVMCFADLSTPGTDYKCRVPSTGSYYSFWKSLVLYCESGYVGTIDNVEVYADGTLPSGLTLYVGDETPASYVQATGSEDTGGDELVSNHSGITGKTDISTYTNSNKKAISGTISGNGEHSDHLVLQLKIESITELQTVTMPTLVFTYDETI